jgi:hypothetical protein
MEVMKAVDAMAAGSTCVVVAEVRFFLLCAEGVLPHLNVAATNDMRRRR